jgi:hypothetical protein
VQSRLTQNEPSLQERESFDIKTSNCYVFGVRTTLTLEDDVALVLNRVREARGLKLKDAINQALRLGLTLMTEERNSEANRQYTHPQSAGKCSIDLVSVSDALAYAEGEGFH